MLITKQEKQTVIQALDARKRLEELLELSYYQDKQFCITRKNKPMAWLVSESFLEAVNGIIDVTIHSPLLLGKIN